MSQKRYGPILRSGTWVLVDPSKFDSPDIMTRFFLKRGQEYQPGYEWDEYIRRGLAFVGERLVLCWDRLPSFIAESLSGTRIYTTEGEVVSMYSPRAATWFEQHPVKRRLGE